MENKIPPNISIDNNKYIICLDSLDLSLLPTTYQPRVYNEPVFLWQKSNLDLWKEGYFEFQIISTTSDDAFGNKSGSGLDANDGLWPNEAHTMCYICKILVPTFYIKEHLLSSKHISYQKIATTALERQMNQESVAKKIKEQSRKQKDTTTYFCDHCVSIVEVKDREDHESSKKHINFKSLDAFLDNFANFYTSSDENRVEKLSKIVDNQCDDLNLNSSYVKVNKNLIFIKDNEATVNNSKGVTDKDATKDEPAIDKKLKEAVTLINNIESCVDNTCKEINNDVTEPDSDENEEADVVNSLKQYIKLIKKHGRVKLETLNSVDQDRIRIITQDGSELVVSVNNFHAFKRTGKKYVQCKMCKVFVSNVNDHIVSEKHIQIVAQPFEDKNCLRRITDALSHCVVCNEVVDNPAVHILFNEHCKKVEQSLVPKMDNNNNPKILKQQESIRDVSQTVEPKSTKHEATVIKSDNVNNITVNNNEQVTVKDSETEDSDSDDDECSNEQVNKRISDEYFCSICNKFMHVNNVETHIRGTKHLMNSKTANNYLMKKCKNGFKCRICYIDVKIFAWAVDDHINSPEHVNKYNQFLADNKINETNVGFFCRPCAKVLPKSYELIHASSQSHKIKLASFNITYIASVDQNKLIENIKRADEYADLSKCEDNIKSNTINNNESVTKLEESLNEASFGDNINNDNAKEIKNKINLSISNTFQCESCNETVINDPERIKLHNESTNHKIMHELLSKVNNLLEQLLKYFNDPPEMHHHLERTSIENELKCKVCTDKVKLEDAVKHVTSLKHVQNLRSLMDTNKLKLRDDKYICYICTVYVENGKELRHINSEEHIDRMHTLRDGDYVSVRPEAKTFIEKISDILKAAKLRKGNPKANDLEFGDFIPLNTKVELKTDFDHYKHFIDLIDNDNELICAICQVCVDYVEEEMISHINNSNHKSNYNDIMEYNQIYIVKSGFVCGFCESIFVGNELTHILSPQHEENFTNDPKKNYCFKCNVSTIDLDLKEHLTSPQHIKAIKSASNALYYCNVCDIKITNNESNIQRHKDGFQHKNNCLSIERNRLILKNRKCYCQICESHFSRDSLDDHIRSSNHILLFGEVN